MYVCLCLDHVSGYVLVCFFFKMMIPVLLNDSSGGRMCKLCFVFQYFFVLLLFDGGYGIVCPFEEMGGY